MCVCDVLLQCDSWCDLCRLGYYNTAIATLFGVGIRFEQRRAPNAPNHIV